jgi:Mn2+/Fe2+ NRAMP family transporter
MAIVAVFGTTISPYLFFWQASQEVEDVRANRGEKSLKHAPAQATVQLDRIRTDTYVGMAFSNVVAFFIILTAASKLHTHGVTEVATCAQADAALKPIAGRFATALFVCGIVGTGMLAVPVLAASAAYGIGEGVNGESVLKSGRIKRSAFTASLASPSRPDCCSIFYTSIPSRLSTGQPFSNGLVAAPLIMMMASNRKVMGKFVISVYLRRVAWCATGVKFCVCFAMVLSWKA